MRIAIAQINAKLGDFKGNKERILRYVEQARQKRAELIVFPECSLLGYHPFDLLERREFIDQQLKEFQNLQKKIPEDMAVVVGLIIKNPSPKGKPYFNAAAFLTKGRKPIFFRKQLLPTGDVFDEARFIESGSLKENFISWKGKKFFISICEDIWAWPDAKGRSPYKENPIQQIKNKRPDLVINLSASPYHTGKLALRKYVTQKTAKHFKAPLLYVNLVGAQDEIIFDGQSFLLDSKGKQILKCQPFEEDLNVFELDKKTVWGVHPAKMSAAEELRRALVLGIRDFVTKAGLKKVHLGLSGGIDSAVVACLAVDALGPQNVTGIALPGPFSSDLSLKLAKKLAEELRIQWKEISINSAYKTLVEELTTPLGISEMGITQENLQSRLRGIVLMAYANKEMSLLLTTGNKCEYATGYSTLYGDMCGGLAPIGDLIKQQVYGLANIYNLDREVIPREIISRPPTAELRPNQTDQDSLPPYDILDKAVIDLVEHSKPARTRTQKWLQEVLYRSEFKRWQAPPILKISRHSFGRGRRWPIAHA